MKKYDTDIFTYANLKYWNSDSNKESIIDKLNKFWEKLFIAIFTLNGYWEKISDKLMKILTWEK